MRSVLQTILAVDDDPVVLDLLAASFEGATVTASGVAEAERLLRDQRFTRVVSDLNLGDGDGITVLLAARDLQPWARRWLITGDPDERSVRAVATGLAERVIRKPWTLDELRGVAP
ncbi:MAG: response regulator [Pseudomonadota bacterium]|nr:response regulator [Pseudomonadota bacterium]